MAGFLVIALCVALSACLAERCLARDPDGWSLRHSLIVAIVLVGTWTVLGAELLSLGHFFRRWPVLLWWAAPTIAATAIAWRGRSLLRSQLLARVPSLARDRVLCILLLACTSLLVVTGLIAARTLTNTWDCWTYHLPRQLYWIQQGSVADYAAYDRRQLEMPPMAEFLGAHLMLLSGGDGWSNMIQWFAFLGSAIAASQCAAELGATTRGQAIAAFLVVTASSALNESMNGKNDVVVGLWVLSMGALAARALRRREFGLVAAAPIGLAMGLAILTKGTGYVAAAPVGAAFGIVALARARWRAVPAGIVIGVAAAALNLGHWSRNIHEFGHPLGVPLRDNGYPVTNINVTPLLVASSFVKELAMHASTRSDRWNAQIESAVASLHERIGVDLNDPRNTMLQALPFKLAASELGDGNDPDPAHVAIALLLLVAGLGRPSLVRAFPGWAAFAVPYIGFVLFAAVLRWQPWALKLQIPVVLLIAPVAGCLLTRRWLPIVGTVLLAAAFVSSWAALVHDSARSLTGPTAAWRESRRASLYHNCPDLQEPLEAAVSRLAKLHPGVVGLNVAMSSYEYPIMRQIRTTLTPTPLIVSLNPNFGPRSDRNTVIPDAVIGIAEDNARPVQEWTTKTWFVPLETIPPFTIYTRSASFAQLPGEDLPLFFGWQQSEGLSASEGPFPKWDLPVVRWAKEARTRLRFSSDGRPATIVMECRRNDRNDQQMRVLLNGREVYSFSFGGEWVFYPIQIPIQPVTGENTIEIEYANTNAPGPPRSVLYKRLQVVPSQAAQKP